MSNYLQMTSIFVHGENFNLQESMVFFVSLQVKQVVCEFSFWYNLIAYRFLAKSEVPAQTHNESHQKFKHIEQLWKRYLKCK